MDGWASVPTCRGQKHGNTETKGTWDTAAPLLLITTMWTLPPDSPVPSQDTMLNFLLLLFIHVRDAIFEELKKGTERDD